jgi:hypothetical protein
MCMSIYVCILGAHRGQKRVLDLVELELQIVASCRIGTGNWTWVLSARAVTALSHQAMSPAPKNKFHQKLKSGQMKNDLTWIVKAETTASQSGNLKTKLVSSVGVSQGKASTPVMELSLVRRCGLSGAHHPAGRDSRDLGQLSLPL